MSRDMYPECEHQHCTPFALCSSTCTSGKTSRSRDGTGRRCHGATGSVPIPSWTVFLEVESCSRKHV